MPSASFAPRGPGRQSTRAQLLPVRASGGGAAAASVGSGFYSELARRSQMPGNAAARIHVIAEHDGKSVYRHSNTMRIVRDIDPNAVLLSQGEFLRGPAQRLRGPLVLIDDESRWMQPQEWLSLPGRNSQNRPALRVPYLAVLEGPQINDFRGGSRNEFHEAEARLRAFVSGGFELYDYPLNSLRFEQELIDAFTRPE